MLSRHKYTQLAAIAALTALFGATSSTTTASAQAGVQVAQAERKHDAQPDVRKSTTTRTIKTNREPRASTSDRSKKSVTTRTTTRTVVRRDNDRRRVVVRSRPSSSVAFVVLGPRVVYRAYGSGWCRALHSGRHWAPRIGWHRGRHVGAVRCG